MGDMMGLKKEDEDPVQEWVDKAEKLLGKDKVEALWKGWDKAT